MRPGGSGGWGSNPRKIPHVGGSARKPSHNSPWADAMNQEPQSCHGTGILGLQAKEDVNWSTLRSAQRYSPWPTVFPLPLVPRRCSAQWGIVIDRSVQILDLQNNPCNTNKPHSTVSLALHTYPWCQLASCVVAHLGVYSK